MSQLPQTVCKSEKSLFAGGSVWRSQSRFLYIFWRQLRPDLVSSPPAQTSSSSSSSSTNLLVCLQQKNTIPPTINHSLILCNGYRQHALTPSPRDQNTLSEPQLYKFHPCHITSTTDRLQSGEAKSNKSGMPRLPDPQVKGSRPSDTCAIEISI